MLQAGKRENLAKRAPVLVSATRKVSKSPAKSATRSNFKTDFLKLDDMALG
jgi:hypothetical protein